MELSVIAPINQLGYGIASLNIVNSLIKLGHKVSLFPINGSQIQIPEHISHKYVENLKLALDNATLFGHTTPSLRIWHQHDMALSVGKGLRIGMPIFELDTFTSKEKHHLTSLDKIIVNSNWAKDVINSNIPEWFGRKYVAPLGVDSELFVPAINPRTTTVFLNIGKWEIRKGHDVLVKVFNKAFDENDDVELWMCCTNPFYSDEDNKSWENFYKQSRLGSKIKIIPRQNSQIDIAYLIQNADCGVFLSRGEGWNLEALEMLSCGKRLIITDYSAHTEFCDNNNSFLVDINESESANDGVWFKGQGNWAKISDAQIDQAVEHMRAVHKTKREGNIVNYPGIDTAKKLSWENTAEKVVEAINAN